MAGAACRAGDLPSAGKEVAGVKYSVQVSYRHCQESAEKSQLCALPGPWADS